MMKNGPNGTYVRRPMRLVARSVISTTPLEDEREDDAPKRTFAPDEQADTGEELDVTEPEGAGTEWDRRQIQGSRDDDGGEHGRDDVRTDQRVAARERVDEGDRDDRQCQEVGQETLVEVRREADDERDEPGSEHDEGDRVRAEPDRQEPEGEGADERDDALSASRPAARAGALRRARASGSRTGRRRYRGRSPPLRGRPRADPSVSSSRRVRSGVPRVPRVAAVSPPRRRRAPARRASRGRRRSRPSARTAAPCGSRRCPRCRGGPTAWSRTRGGTARS